MMTTSEAAEARKVAKATKSSTRSVSLKIGTHKSQSGGLTAAGRHASTELQVLIRRHHSLKTATQAFLCPYVWCERTNERQQGSSYTRLALEVLIMPANVAYANIHV